MSSAAWIVVAVLLVLLVLLWAVSLCGAAKIGDRQYAETFDNDRYLDG